MPTLFNNLLSSCTQEVLNNGIQNNSLPTSIQDWYSGQIIKLLPDYFLKNLLHYLNDNITDNKFTVSFIHEKNFGKLFDSANSKSSQLAPVSATSLIHSLEISNSSSASANLPSCESSDLNPFKSTLSTSNTESKSPENKPLPASNSISSENISSKNSNLNLNSSASNNYTLTLDSDSDHDKTIPKLNKIKPIVIKLRDPNIEQLHPIASSVEPAKSVRNFLTQETSESAKKSQLTAISQAAESAVATPNFSSQSLTNPFASNNTLIDFPVPVPEKRRKYDNNILPNFSDFLSQALDKSNSNSNDKSNFNTFLDSLSSITNTHKNTSGSHAPFSNLVNKSSTSANLTGTSNSNPYSQITATTTTNGQPRNVGMPKPTGKSQVISKLLLGPADKLNDDEYEVQNPQNTGFASKNRRITYLCKLCDKVFAGERTFATHFHQEHNRKLYTCLLCYKEMARNDTIYGKGLEFLDLLDVFEQLYIGIFLT